MNNYQLSKTNCFCKECIYLKWSSIHNIHWCNIQQRVYASKEWIVSHTVNELGCCDSYKNSTMQFTKINIEQDFEKKSKYIHFNLSENPIQLTLDGKFTSEELQYLSNELQEMIEYVQLLKKERQ